MKSSAKLEILRMVEAGELLPHEALLKIKELVRLEKVKVGIDVSEKYRQNVTLEKLIEEELVIGITKILKVPQDRIYIDCNLKDFGFDSITFTGFSNYITEKFNIELTPNVFLENETVQELSNYLLNEYSDELVERFKTIENGCVNKESVIEKKDQNLWKISSSDELNLEFWKKDIRNISEDIKYDSMTNLEFKNRDKKYLHLLVNTSINRKMEVVVAGKGRTKLIVGGVGMATPMVLKQVEYFSKNNQVVVIHNPGCGLSEDIDDYSLEARVTIVVDVLKKLDVIEPIDFIGISWGGMIGQLMSVYHSEKIAKLILISSIFEIANENPNINADEAMKNDLANSNAKSECYELLEQGKCINSKIFAKYLEYYLPGSDKSYTTLDYLEKISVPVLVMYGNRDTIIQPSQSKLISNKVQNSTLFKIEDGGHFIFLTHHDILNDKIELFTREKSCESSSTYAIGKKETWIKHIERWENELNIKGIEEYDGLEGMLNELCTCYAYTYLKENGINTNIGNVYNIEALVEQFKILKSHKRLFYRMIDMLVEDKVVRIQDRMIQFIKEPALVNSAEILKNECIVNYSEFRGLIEFLNHCCSNYKKALSGQIAPISVIFPKGQSDALEKSNNTTIEYGKERLYAKVVNDVLKTITQEKKETIKILEVGGGTGLLTRHLLEITAKANVEYYFTDISDYFIKKAKEVEGFNNIKFKLFDISKNPVEQGIGKKSFDIILGLNVVHATPNISKTVGNLKTLLTNDGALILIEASKKLRWVDMVWGLTEGWWCFEDTDVRKSSPIMNIYDWEKIFEEQKFSDVKAYPESAEKRFDTNCALLVALN